jgi:hypothetical protein
MDMQRNSQQRNACEKEYHDRGNWRQRVNRNEIGEYGLEVNDQSLVSGRNPRLGSMHFAEWLSQSTTRRELRKAA